MVNFCPCQNKKIPAEGAGIEFCNEGPTAALALACQRGTQTGDPIQFPRIG